MTIKFKDGKVDRQDWMIDFCHECGFMYVDELADIVDNFLAYQEAIFLEETMCPNCVTPWKCNGPHINE